MLHGQFGLLHSETLSQGTELAKIKTKPKTATENSIDLLNSDSNETCGPLLIFEKFILRTSSRAGKMSQQVKTLVSKTYDLSPLIKICVVEGEN